MIDYTDIIFLLSILVPCTTIIMMLMAMPIKTKDKDKPVMPKGWEKDSDGTNK